MIAKNVYIKTFGCVLNQSDSEVMAGLLRKEGYSIVSSIDEADIIIINTCGVKEPTEHRVLSYLKQISKKYNKKVKIIAGCLPLMDVSRVISVIPNYSAIIGPEYIDKIVNVISLINMGERPVLLRRPKRAKRNIIEKYRKSKVIGIVPIANGCLGACAFCSVKFARGHLNSNPIEDIINEITWLVKNGYKEIWLTAQDTGVYGFDLGYTLVNLLEKIIEIDGDFKVRVGMMNPSGIKSFAENLASLFKSDKIFKFLHIPVQSGSNKILEYMNRKYSVEEFIEIIEIFRKYNPHLTLSTDIIVGYPGETDEDFQETIDLIKRIKPDIVNISRYGKRPNTPASKLPNQIPSEIKKKRSKILSELVEKISYENNKKWLDWEGYVLIDEISKKNDLIGRNFAYKPIVIKMENEKASCAHLLTENLGKYKKVKIFDISPHVLFGRFS
ncbi:MAG: tRNA (N(6)-L-threonylcarbamoyladenosine(37)-C(2))-methylthiotransferase [Candidatus Odinarchaeota archaeon]|nr:tRNA (N(6)-L-threonylcarbamoyladenosine(37)-C(2))-methylthiotransferase [Candidatus Odinarchaeota archaeon]